MLIINVCICNFPVNLRAGNCNETNYNGSTFYDAALSVFRITIPIEPCGMKKELYDNPVSRSTGSFYSPTANVTLGERMGQTDIVFRRMMISAECGIKTSYREGLRQCFETAFICPKS